MKQVKFTRVFGFFLSTALIFSLYIVFAVALDSVVAFFIYFGVLTAILLYYVIYNRGFSRHSLTVESMPSHLSYAEKLAILKERDARKKKSMWALYFLFPGLLSLFYECLALFILPNLGNLFGG